MQQQMSTDNTNNAPAPHPPAAGTSSGDGRNAPWGHHRTCTRNGDPAADASSASSTATPLHPTPTHHSNPSVQTPPPTLETPIKLQPHLIQHMTGSLRQFIGESTRTSHSYCTVSTKATGTRGTLGRAQPRPGRARGHRQGRGVVYQHQIECVPSVYGIAPVMQI